MPIEMIIVPNSKFSSSIFLKSESYYNGTFGKPVTFIEFYTEG